VRGRYAVPIKIRFQNTDDMTDCAYMYGLKAIQMAVNFIFDKPHPKAKVFF